jgi:hypothetical protein
MATKGHKSHKEGQNHWGKIIGEKAAPAFAQKIFV